MKLVYILAFYTFLILPIAKANSIYDFALNYQKTFLGVGYNYFDGSRFARRSFFGVQSEVISGKGVNVAILSTGVNYSAPFFKNNIFYQDWGVYDFRSYGYGYDLIDGDAFPSDEDGRGTFISALIKSIAPEVQITPVRIMNNSNDEVAAEKVLLGIRYAYEKGARVIQLPLAIVNSYYESNRLQRLMAEQGYFDKEDVLFVVTKDTSLSGKSLIFEQKNVISVCGLDIYGRELFTLLESHSQYDVCALGQDIYSLSVDGYGLTRKSGSFIAASFVTSLASLISQVNSSLTANEIKYIIMNNVEKSRYLEYSTLSGGYISFDKALSQILE